MALSGLLNQSIIIKNPSGTKDIHGKEALAAGTTVKARVERTRKSIMLPDRQRAPIDAIIFVSSATVQIGAQVEYDSQKYRVMAVDDIVGGGGSLHHRELQCQLWSYS